MATDRDFITFVMDQVSEAGLVTSRKMFGEYALYCDGKVVALVCDNNLYVKPTDAGRAYIGNVTERPAYPGARPSFLIEEQLDDRNWLTGLIKITCRNVPEPKRHKGRSSKNRIQK